MAPITEETVRRLAGLKLEHRPVVTLYLDVDGRRWPKFQDCEARAQLLVRDAMDRSLGNGHAVAAADLERIHDYVRGGIDRSRTRGLAVFSAGDDLWEVYPLPVPVRDQLVVNETPHVGQLEAVVDNHEAFGVLLVDRQRARMFVFELGALTDKSELFDELPRREDEGGHRDQPGHLAEHIDAAVRHHLRRAAGVAFEIWKRHSFEHLIIAAPDDLAPTLERDLHSYLRDRIAARVNLPATASEAEICQTALEVEEAIERDRHARLVRRLRDAVATTGGVAGLQAVLGALVERRVDTLVVSEGYATEGWRCGNCGNLAPVGPTCDLCDHQMTLVDDIVEAAIEEALRQSCKVKVCVGDADLDVLGRIGALLRF